MTDLMLLPEFGKIQANLAHGAVFCVCVGRVWEWVGYKSSLGGTWHPAKVSRAVIVPAGPQLGSFVLQRLRKTMCLSLLRGAKQANTT